MRAGIQQPRGDRIALQDLPDCFHGAAGLERGPAGQQEVKHGSQSVHVRRRPDLLDAARRLLGRHIAGSPQDLPGGRQLVVGFHLGRQTKVRDSRRTGGGQQDVARLQVAMHDPVVVGVLDRLAHLGHQFRRLAGLEGKPHCAVCQTLAVDETHRVEMLAGKLVHFVDRHDPRMIQPRGRFGFGIEAFDVVRRGELAGQDHLQGHDPVQLDLPRLVDHPHPAAGEFLDQLIVAERAVLWRDGRGTRPVGRGTRRTAVERGRHVIAGEFGRIALAPPARTRHRRGTRGDLPRLSRWIARQASVVALAAFVIWIIRRHDAPS